MPSLNKIETETELHEKSEGSFKKAEKELEVQSLNWIDFSYIKYWQLMAK